MEDELSGPVRTGSILDVATTQFVQPELAAQTKEWAIHKTRLHVGAAVELYDPLEMVII